MTYIRLDLQFKLLHTISVFGEYSRELDFLSVFLSPNMIDTMTRTWSEAIQLSFSQTISDYYGELN